MTYMLPFRLQRALCGTHLPVKALTKPAVSSHSVQMLASQVLSINYIAHVMGMNISDTENPYRINRTFVALNHHICKLTVCYPCMGRCLHHICIYIYTYIYNTHIYIYITYIYMHTYLFMCTHIYTYTHTYTHTYIYIYMCIYIHAYTHTHTHT